jgi:hypothetical protein
VGHRYNNDQIVSVNVTTLYQRKVDILSPDVKEVRYASKTANKRIFFSNDWGLLLLDCGCGCECVYG